jgi:hypothetical protein
MSTAMPPKPPPPKPAPPAAKAIGSAPSRKFAVSSGRDVGAQRIGIFGTGGIGKTKLASLLKDVGIRPLIVDIENGSRFLDVERIGDIQNFNELRGILQDQELLAPYGAVVIDSFTRAEEMAIAHTLKTVPTEGKNGQFVDKIEAYGFGKGYTHAYETFLQILGDLDAVIRSGKHVVAICHDFKANVPNPSGEDWIRYEPRLQETPKGPIRSRVFEWCDHFFYIGYDVAVEDGRGSGSGTRTIYPAEMPTHKAKSRDLADPIVYVDGDAGLWNLLLKKGS